MTKPLHLYDGHSLSSQTSVGEGGEGLMEETNMYLKVQYYRWYVVTWNKNLKFALICKTTQPI